MIPIGGPMAAVLTPRTDSGQVDVHALQRNVEFILGCGSTGVCVNGATGEYTRATADERRCAVEAARKVVGAGSILLAGCGGASWEECYTAAAHALDCGAHAVLVPTPHFFRYEDQDIEEFYLELARRLDGPILLYNLPQFTNEIAPAVVARLVHTVPAIIGIKDSSGSLLNLRQLSTNGSRLARRIVGHDGVLAEALQERCLDGVISGVAGVVPELNVALFGAFASADAQRRQQVVALQAELVRSLGPIPVPWGLKVIAARRGLCAESYPLPLATRRKAQLVDFAAWFDEWSDRAMAILNGWQMAAANSAL
jgi:4-hydroxy-tetrahydrodipicolinate synthase